MGGSLSLALVLACLGTGRAILEYPSGTPRFCEDGVARLTGLALLTWLAGWLSFGWHLLTRRGLGAARNG